MLEQEFGGKMTVRCPKCGVFVNNLRRHRDRGRCAFQHVRKYIKEKKKEVEKDAEDKGTETEAKPE